MRAVDPKSAAAPAQEEELEYTVDDVIAEEQPDEAALAQATPAQGTSEQPAPKIRPALAPKGAILNKRPVVLFAGADAEHQQAIQTLTASDDPQVLKKHIAKGYRETQVLKARIVDLERQLAETERSKREFVLRADEQRRRADAAELKLRNKSDVPDAQKLADSAYNKGLQDGLLRATANSFKDGFAAAFEQIGANPVFKRRPVGDPAKRQEAFERREAKRAARANANGQPAAAPAQGN